MGARMVRRADVRPRADLGHVFRWRKPIMADPLAETWAIHNRINLYMLDAIPDAAMGATASPKCRTVHDLFAHVHNVRLLWLKAAAPELLAGLEKLETKTVGDKAKLRGAGSVRPSRRAAPGESTGGRGQDQGVQAARHGVPGLPDLARVAPPRPGRLGAEDLRPSAGQEDGLWSVGMGGAVRAPSDCVAHAMTASTIY